MSAYRMDGMNLELTTACPLHCPQCYCTLEGGRHLDLEVAKAKLKEAGEHGVHLVHLSGGETMCYPDLYELVAYAAECCGTVHVALSGYHFDEAALDSLIQAGVSGIFISLNGSTPEINSLTRDGYELAIQALELLKARNYPNTWINWVMHSNNTDDFPNVIRLAEAYNVAHLVVLAFKPDAKHQLLSFPSGEQIYRVAQQIRDYKGSLQLVVETCYSQLLTVIRDTRLLGNLNFGPTKGCRAGLYNYSITVDGQYAPCRHLDFPEDHPTLDDYLEKSPIVERLRHIEEDPQEPCSACRFKGHCRPCMAVSSKLNGNLTIGHDICDLWQTRA